MIVPLVAAAAGPTDDLDAVASGLNQVAYELDGQRNAPFPIGM